MVDDATKTLFLNLIALERLHVRARNKVTSYIFFMDNIIDNQKMLAFCIHKVGAVLGNNHPLMEFPTRLTIALGAVKGIAYIDKDCTIHHDRGCPKTTTLLEAFRVRYRLSYGRCLCWNWFPRNLGSGIAAGASSLLFVYSLDYARTCLANDSSLQRK
ncbi:UPF0481 protein [Artemisia annua]|uniref:UPF0481 protein n=1 Tax=Artemisia annua TaxID=35608 RepID=A0A2U1L1G4_ARTAN|nr:UPF0481 protein [Artemisia annua]